MAQDCKLRDWSQQDRQAGRTIAFGLWNGKISIQVYNNQDMKNKLFRRNFDECEILLIEKLINKIMAGSPESKQSIQFQKYDFQSKQFKMEAVFEFGKDSKQVYHVTVTDCVKQQSFTFVIKARATMTMGSEPLNDANLSALKVEALKDWIASAKICAPFTVQPIDPNKQRGGYGNRGGGGGGYQAPAQQAPVGGGDGGGDLPF